MTAKVILNPYSNRWNAERRWPEAAAALTSAGVDFELAVSERQHQPIELAEQAARQGFSPIIAAGGDGTIGEVVNGMARAAKSDSEPLGPFGVIPLGTANDLACNIGLPLDLAGAARAIGAGTVRKMDVCKVNDLYFVNNSAIGLEPYITLVQERITWIKGMARYLVAAVRGIMDNPHWNAKLEWDGGQFEGPVLFVTVGNGPRTGGVFYMAPHADPFDGKLTFAHAFRARPGQILKLLPTAMKPGAGNYVEAEGAFEGNAAWLKVHFDAPAPAHIDGEIFSKAITDLEYRVLPGRLGILYPAQS
jgi:diacylglycerol kinase (ATP)